MLTPEEMGKVFREKRDYALEQLNPMIRETVNEYAGLNLSYEEQEERYQFIAVELENDPAEGLVFFEAFIVIDPLAENIIVAHTLEGTVNTVVGNDDDSFTLACSVASQDVTDQVVFSVIDSGDDFSDLFVNKKEQE